MNMTDNKEPVYDSKALKKELQEVKANLKNILDRIVFQQNNRNSSTTNIDKAIDAPKTFKEMDIKTIAGLINEIHQITTELHQTTLEVESGKQK